MKKFLISSIIFSIVILTACAPAAPIATATSVPSETPTIQPSSTPPATPTLEPTIEATATQPAPPANPGFVEGIGNITSVVQRESDNKWYGLNELGMAVTVQNEKGEWIPYERPMNIAQNETDPVISIESLGLKEIAPENVTRLNGGALNIDFPWIENPSADELNKLYDQALPFGIVLEEKPFINSTDNPQFRDLRHVYLSGIHRGIVSTALGSNTYPSNFLIYEVPFQFESQIILIMLPDQKFNAKDSVFLVSDSNNVQDADRTTMTDHDLMVALSSPQLVGGQLVIALQVNYTQVDPYEEAFKELITNIKSGKAEDIKLVGLKTASRIFMPKP